MFKDASWYIFASFRIYSNGNKWCITVSIIELLLVVFFINLPFGYWRLSVQIPKVIE